MIKIGVLDLQGDISEHLEMTRKTIMKMKIEDEVIKVKKAKEVAEARELSFRGRKYCNWQTIQETV